MPDLICQQLVDLIERHADGLTQDWLADVKRRPETPTYHDYPEDKLYERVHDVYQNLGKWIRRHTNASDVARVYTALGRQRHSEGFALSEVLEALILTRRHLWLLVLREGFLDTALVLQQALDLNARAVLFFDRAMYFTTLGYEQAQAETARKPTAALAAELARPRRLRRKRQVAEE
ncbi:MAG: RsbRD N-terminal domain-containing protein [Acidimicrobiia bacterium]|nr:RsbRD N-terminal domain-containing protein [Acidimicrobiia bacterium]